MNAFCLALPFIFIGVSFYSEFAEPGEVDETRSRLRILLREAQMQKERCDVAQATLIHLVHTNFETEVKRLTDGAGVHVIYDSVGMATFEQDLNCMRPRGYIVLYGTASGPVPPVSPQTLSAKGALFLTYMASQFYVATRAELLARTSDLFLWLANGTLKVRIDGRYPLAEAAQAHQRMEERAATGKLLLIPAV